MQIAALFWLSVVRKKIVTTFWSNAASHQNPLELASVIDPFFLHNFFFQDYLTDGHKAPVLDSQNDCKLEEAMQSGDTTTLKYYRKVDTGDSKDVVIEVKN